MKAKHKKTTAETAVKEQEIAENTQAAESAQASEETATVQLPAGNEMQTSENGPIEVKPRGDKVLTKAQQRKRTAIRWALMVVGIILMSISVYFFQIPYNFVLGGVGGIAIMLASVVQPLVSWLTPAVIMLFINVFLLILGFIILGKSCTFKTAFCSLLYTGLILFFEKVVPLDHPVTAVVDKAGNIVSEGQPFLELCIAILLFGVGGAIIFNCGASSGGTDIIALILKKFTKINVGVSLLIVDLIVCSVSIFTVGSVAISLYSFLGLFARTFLLDGIIESFGKTKYITIITQKPDEISEYILNVIQHGYTMYDAEGGYTHEKKKVMITICKRGEALRLKAKVKAFDPEAFVIITDANEILGKGFASGF
ncbi:MAG: YitT family protein [Clostridia bacterium]|nr:YitT family protein [Clostridia bacterium]